jgi:hypothetical protein
MANEPNAGTPPPLPIAPESQPVQREIALPQAGPAAAAATKPAAKTPPQHDSFREFIETIVFVVVLVLILKTFLAEAFVIPTGSMATTLLGYHKDITCQQCGHRFLVNASKEADPAEHERREVTACTCPNCFFVNELRPRFPAPGDLR